MGQKFERNGKQFVVTGLVDSNIYLFWLEGSSGTTPECSLWGFRETNLEIEQPMILYGEEREAAPDLSEKAARRFVYFDKNISQSQYEKNVKEMQRLGGVETLEQMREYSYEEFLLAIQEYLPYIMVFTGTVMMGIFSLSVLNGRVLGKRFCVYYLCGCKRKRSIAIYADYLLLLMTGSIFIYGLLLAGLGWQNVFDMSLYGTLFCREDIGVILAVALLGFGVTCLPVVLLYKRWSAIAVIKNL